MLISRSEDSVVNKTISLYERDGWKKIFAKFRFWYAPFEEVEKLVPKAGNIIDLGCGEGIFSNFLGIASSKRNILGVDVNKKRITMANRGLSNVSFKWGDITKIQFPNVSCIVLFQVLHHLRSYRDQEEVIKSCLESLSENGKLVIVEIRVETSLRYALNWIVDHPFVAWIFEKKLYEPTLFRKINDWTALFKKYNFSCDIQIPNEFKKPFPNVIFYCKKQKINRKI